MKVTRMLDIENDENVVISCGCHTLLGKKLIIYDNNDNYNLHNIAHEMCYFESIKPRKTRLYHHYHLSCVSE